jgi:hypothetical protein
MARRDIGPRPPLAAWIRFHERLLPFRSGFVVVPFDLLTSDIGEAIRRVNERFGTTFDAFVHSPENEALVFERIEARNRERFEPGTIEGRRSLARPTPEREERKQELRRAYDAPPLQALRDRADDLYGLLVGPSDGS